jgi:hypothetical protein
MNQFISKNKNYIILFLFILTVFIGVNIFLPEIETYEDYTKTHFTLGWTDFDVAGILTDKYLGTSHNNPTLVLDCNGKKLKFYFQTNDLEFYDYVNLGDSVVSKRRSFCAIVRKNESDSTFHFIDEN